MSEPVAEVLGPVRLPGRDALPAPVAGVLARRLVVALALAGPEGRSAAALVDDVWGDEAPRNPRAALQMLVSRIRSGSAEGLIASTPSGYRIAGSDLAAAEALAATVARLEPGPIVERTGEALAAWRGEPGADLDDDPLASDLTDRADRVRPRLLEQRANALLALARPAEAAAAAEVLESLRPLDSAPVALLMRAHADSGRVDAALAAFAAYRARLADALGADPDPDLVRLNTELLRGQGTPGSAELVGVRSATTPLLGREQDLARLVATVPANRLTSIIGTGGLGKTRLAHETATLLADRFERVVFTELAGTQAAVDVELVVAAAAGARTVQRARRLGDPLPADLPTRTREVLGARRTLLVLDNCEHVVDAVAALATDLLAAVPSLFVLTTSRVPLLVPGEAIVAPRPLPAATAASALFVDRATAARPGVALDPGLVERVCSRLDGLPLAIELAAARLRSMTLPELDDRLADRFAVLVGSDRTAPDRHRTLLAVIEWSRRLLSPAAADAMATLAVFPDGFTARSADDLLGGNASTVLTELVDHSLLGFTERESGLARFRMLETVREFGLRELAEQGRTETALAALDGWALGFARRTAPGLLAGREPGMARTAGEEEETLLAVLRADRMGDERDVVVTAVGALLAEYWVYRGEFESILGVLPALLRGGTTRARTAEESEEALRALALGASITMIASRPEAARLLALLRRVSRSADPGTSFWRVFAQNLLLSGDLQSGIGALDRLVDDPDPLVAAFARLMRAQLEENSGDTAASLADLVIADTLATRHGFTWFRYLARTSIVSLRSQRGEHVSALAGARRTRQEIVALGIDTDLRQLDWLIGSNAIAVGELEEGERIFTTMAATTGRGSSTDEADNRALALAGLAEVATARGERDRADALWRDAGRISRTATSPWRVVVAAAALSASVRLGVPAEELERPYRRLRTLLLAVQRLQGLQIDAPVFGSGLLGLSMAVRSSDPVTADELVGLAVALGARRDMPSVDAAVIPGIAVPVAREEAKERAIALLRSPALSRVPRP